MNAKVMALMLVCTLTAVGVGLSFVGSGKDGAVTEKDTAEYFASIGNQSVIMEGMEAACGSEEEQSKCAKSQ